MDATPIEKVGACWECGYSLRGLPTPRCPECGRGFDPADETTMNMGTEVRGLSRWLMRPPGWPLYLLTVAAVLTSLWACVMPTRTNAFTDQLSHMLVLGNDYPYGSYFPWSTMFTLSNPMERFLFGASIWLSIGGIWIARRLARGITVKSLSKHKAATFAYWRRWLVIPLIFGITVLACRTSLPIYAGFWLSKPWLDRGVAEAKTSGGWLPPRRMGLFDRYPYVGNSPQVLHREGETLVSLGVGMYFVHREDGEPDQTWHSDFKRLSTNWFWVDTSTYRN